MTPTLRGRRQTRIMLMLWVGIPVTFPFCVAAAMTNPLSFFGPYVMLSVVLLVGLVLDGRYDKQQQERWDHDWPTHLQVRAGIREGLISYVLLFGPCGGIALLNPTFLVVFPVHYFVVWFLSFLIVQGPIRVLFVSWRYRGGELW